jgi:hypothetical protein
MSTWKGEPLGTYEGRPVYADDVARMALDSAPFKVTVEQFEEMRAAVYKASQSFQWLSEIVAMLPPESARMAYLDLEFIRVVEVRVTRPTRHLDFE